MKRQLGMAFAAAAAFACGSDGDGGDVTSDSHPLCREDAVIPADDFVPIRAGYPAHEGATEPHGYEAVPFPPENPYTQEKALLGKILFWEEQISSDDTMACGTCHQAGAGGSDPRAVLAAHPGPDGTLGNDDDIHGARGVKRCQIQDGEIVRVDDALFGSDVQATGRKAPSYLDAMFYPDIFWDGRATSQYTVPNTGEIAIVAGGALESQSMGPPTSDVEMACEDRTWDDIEAKLEVVVPLQFASDLPEDMAAVLCDYPTYPELFAWAFPDDPVVSAKNVAFAIATHERTLVSNETPWDRFMAGDETALTGAAKRGWEIYEDRGKCQRCHVPPSFHGDVDDNFFANLGLVDASFDTGRQQHTGDPLDRGKFKTPTLRNVALREAGGLLHDGAGAGSSLEEVMDVYNEPPALDTNTDERMLADEELELTDEEIADIIEFMRTGLTDPRVETESYPFDRPTLGSER